MRIFRVLLVLAVAIGLSACSSGKFKSYNGPEVTRVEVHKSARKMYLLHHNKVLRQYDVALGFSPQGHKAFEGDGRTPEGVYIIDRQNPDSQFHLSIGMSYPNANDVQVARASGKSPGGDIFIHGRANRQNDRNRGRDWTDGCIAVTDKEMEEIYSMVRVGTQIAVFP
ncbi:MAG: L,D-transpeptidase family protein [Gemmobacter sp.]|nr:L,D-transpeptidase family protein [Gemmobacter sp.]